MAWVRRWTICSTARRSDVIADLEPWSAAAAQKLVRGAPSQLIPKPIPYYVRESGNRLRSRVRAPSGIGLIPNRFPTGNQLRGGGNRRVVRRIEVGAFPFFAAVEDDPADHVDDPTVNQQTVADHGL